VVTLRETIAAARARAEAATPGPWDHNEHTGDVWQHDGYVAGDPDAPDTRLASVHHRSVLQNGRIVSTCQPNAAFIAAARTDVPALCAALEEALTLLEDCEGVAADVGHPLLRDAIRAFLAGKNQTENKQNMDINNLTLGQIKEVASIATGLCATPSASANVDSGEVRIVILQRGWVVVGYYKRANGRVFVSKACVIRNWGTAKGLGELIAGPTAKTVLEPCGEVDAHELAEIASIKCDTSKWTVLK
jgi:hypothetical protein